MEFYAVELFLGYRLCLDSLDFRTNLVDNAIGVPVVALATDVDKRIVAHTRQIRRNSVGITFVFANVLHQSATEITAESAYEYA